MKSIEEILSLKGDKYSPNLRAWLNQWARKKAGSRFELPSVYQSPSCLMIGFIPTDEANSFIGTRLISVLCNGATEGTFFFQKMEEWKELHDFWSQYIAIGRCAIDRNHNMIFVGDDARWQEDGLIRTCLWCGHEQVKLSWVERIEKSEWVSA